MYIYIMVCIWGRVEAEVPTKKKKKKKKKTMWFPNRSDTNRPVQAQERARSLKFRI